MKQIDLTTATKYTGISKTVESWLETITDRTCWNCNSFFNEAGTDAEDNERFCSEDCEGKYNLRCNVLSNF